jgi:hypothetical protein
VTTAALILSIEIVVKFLRWTMASDLDVWYVGNRSLESHGHSEFVTQSCWMLYNLRSTWHPGGTVILEEDLIVTNVKVKGYLIVVEKLDGEKMIHCNLKNVLRSSPIDTCNSSNNIFTFFAVRETKFWRHILAENWS